MDEETIKNRENESAEKSTNDEMAAILGDDSGYELHEDASEEQEDDFGNDESTEEPTEDDGEEQPVRGDDDKDAEAEDAQSDVEEGGRDEGLPRYDVAEARKNQINGHIRDLVKKRDSVKNEITQLYIQRGQLPQNKGVTDPETGKELSVEDLITDYASPYTGEGETPRPFTVNEAQYFLSKSRQEQDKMRGNVEKMIDQAVDTIEELQVNTNRVVAEFGDVLNENPELDRKLTDLYMQTIQYDSLGNPIGAPVNMYDFYSTQLGAIQEAKKAGVNDIEQAQRKVKKEMRDRTDMPRRPSGKKATKKDTDEMSMLLEKDEQYI